MNGVLVVDKPSGPTSFDVVQKLVRAFKVKKAGHTGTLDPLATGVLPVCFGEATKLVQFLTDADKTYEAVLQLGAETDTLDAQGTVTSTSAVPLLNATLLEATLAPFRGKSLQQPPMFSAVKVGGKRLYELAREGETVERASREVEVFSLRLLDFTAKTVALEVSASKGFFVRVLAQDIGRSLGCGAHLSALRRTRSGQFSAAQSIPLEEALRAPELARQRLVGVGQALSSLPAVAVDGPTAERVLHGAVLRLEAQAQGLIRLVDSQGRVLALADCVEGQLRYRRVFTEPML